MQSLLPRLPDDDETKTSNKNNEEVAFSVRGQALLCLPFAPLQSVMAFFVIHIPHCQPPPENRPCLPLLPVPLITRATLHQRAEHAQTLAIHDSRPSTALLSSKPLSSLNIVILTCRQQRSRHLGDVLFRHLSRHVKIRVMMIDSYSSIDCIGLLKPSLE
jgi:hypothetical protein